MTLSDLECLSKFSMMRSVVWPVCDCSVSCYRIYLYHVCISTMQHKGPI